jgi:heptosyltransferase I
MRMLLVKMSSLGDLVHCFPAISDAMRARPGLCVDWVVERGFVDVAALHPGVELIIPVDIRAWRRDLRHSLPQARAFLQQLRARHYDLVLDTQGLLKSGIVARLACGAERAGPDRASARERLACMFYRRRLSAPRGMHAIDRQRALFGAALGYVPDAELDYGLAPAAEAAGDGGADTSRHVARRLVFLHGTSWPSKEWPLAFWRRLAEQAHAAGFSVLLPWGNDDERRRAAALAASVAGCNVLPRCSLAEMIGHLRAAAGVVAVDTGLGHLAAALGVPTVGLYGPTDPALTGLAGPRVENLDSAFECAPCGARVCRYRGTAVSLHGEKVLPPCFSESPPERVWEALTRTMAGGGLASRAGTTRL